MFGISRNYCKTVIRKFEHLTGTHTAVAECVKRLTKPGEGVIVLTPSYSYHGDVDAIGRTYVPVEMFNNNGYYTINFEALEEACANDNNTTHLQQKLFQYRYSYKILNLFHLRTMSSSEIGVVCTNSNVFIG